ncbi:MAG: phosphomannomutase/phosphoglucomutase [Candidatus Reddybacter sp.]
MKLPTDFNSAIKTPVVVAGSVLVVIYTIFLTQLFYSKLVTEPWHQAITHEAGLLAQNQAASIEDYFIAMDEKLEKIVKDRTLINILKSENVEQIKEYKDLLRHQLTEMADIKLVSVNSPYFAETQNFVGITLAKNSIAGKQLEPAAVKLHDWLIVTATPIADYDEVVGSLISNLSVRNIHAVLSQADPTLGQTELLQYTRGFAPQVIVSSGGSNTPFQATAPVKGRADWQLLYSVSAKLVDTVGKPFLYFTLSFIALLVISLLLLVLLIRYQLSHLREESALDDTDLTPAELNQLIQEKLTRRPTEPASPTLEISEENEERTSSNEVFRQYDIRGDANTQITEDFALRLGKAVGSDMVNSGQRNLLIGSDGRRSSPRLKTALIEGVLSTGCNVIDIGVVPTPVLNFALASMDTVDSGIMVTASHNPASDNGFKIYYNQQVISGAEILSLKTAMEAHIWKSGQGQQKQLDFLDQYTETLLSNISPATRQLRVVIDCANGAAGPVAPALLEALGCEVIPLYCDIDGSFPNHPPDPSDPENLTDLITIVKHEGADLGLAFDGDGDRLVAITAEGGIVWADELLMIFARDVIGSYPETDIVFDVKSTRRLGNLINNYGGNPVMWKTGHSHIRRKISETGAPLGGEFSGHIFFNDRWFGFDDGLYAAARLIEIINQREQSLDQIIAGFETSVSTPELRVAIPDDQKFIIANKFAEGVFPEAKRITIDGLRLEYPDGWALIRASNTSAHLTLRFEADDQQVLARLKHQLKQKLTLLLPDTKLPF